MTTPLAYQLDRRSGARGAPAPTKELRSFPGDLAAAIRYALEAQRKITWPSPRYRDDPVAFFREILGCEPWHKQVELLESVRDHKRVAVRSGHKVSKSHSAGGLALWFYCSFPDARVVMTSTTARQVEDILWRELRMMISRHGICVACKRMNAETLAPWEQITAPCEHSALIGDKPAERARTGLRSRDFREIVGFTAKEAEAVAGVSGKNLLYIVDEASGVGQQIFEAIEGNRAGGARIVMFSNPTRNEGEHFDAFFAKRDLYKTLTISSEETPNVVERRVVIPGLAEWEWVEEKRREWGEDSALYKVRVKGEHALNEDGKIFSVHAIAEAEKRWYETEATGLLYVGLDPAGEDGSGDEIVFALRRGLKLLKLHVKRGLSAEGHLTELLALIAEHKVGRETPVVVLDREGSVGAQVYGVLRDFAHRHPGVFELAAVRASDRATRQPDVYDRQRDALAASLAAWIKEGGAIPEDAKLAAELHTLEWTQGPLGRIKLTPKREIRKKLGRSPDRYDAVALSVWEPLALREDPAPPAHEDTRDEGESPMLDPYAGSMAWGG